MHTVLPAPSCRSVAMRDWILLSAPMAAAIYFWSIQTNSENCWPGSQYWFNDLDRATASPAAQDGAFCQAASAQAPSTIIPIGSTVRGSWTARVIRSFTDQIMQFVAPELLDG